MHDAPLTRVTGSSDSVPTEASGPYRDVVLGVDIREDCDAVIAFAFDAAARRAAGLRVVHGWTTPLVYTQYAAVDAGQAVAQALSDLLGSMAIGERSDSGTLTSRLSWPHPQPNAPVPSVAAGRSRIR